MTFKNTSTASMSLVASAVIALLAAVPAHGAENRAQRYTAGLGGTDMTTMLSPGWYGQVAAIHYHANKLRDQNGDSAVLASGTLSAATVAGAAGLVAATGAGNPALATPIGNSVAAQLAGQGLSYNTKVSNFRADAYVALPRVTYISANKFLGAHVGFTAMLPLIERQTSLEGQTFFSDRSAAINQGILNATGNATLASGATASTVSRLQTGVNAQVNPALAKRNGSNTGLGDLEFAPVLNWEIGDHQTATLTPTLIVPTGDYHKENAVNPGFGKFYTFRPSFQYGFIGDGWDVGARAIVSFNTRNKDTLYHSGTMFNVDFAAMKFVTEDVRLGLQGYLVRQLTKDASDDALVQASINAADGAKMRAYALGPALGWIVNGGEMVVEGKLLKEFGARNRAEGTTYMLVLSKPFGL